MYKEYVVSGLSVAVATTCTNPLDVVKVRLQLNRSAGKQSGLVNTGYQIIKHEGVSALWKGVGPSIARGLFYGGLRLGLYSPIKSVLAPDGQASFVTKLSSGTLSGAFAAALSSPTELIKTRLQAKSDAPQSIMSIIRQVTQQRGVWGLWQGSLPGMARASILTATQCASYDEVKQFVRRVSGWGDHAGTHFTCSMITGLVTTTATNPVDVIKTHMFVGGQKSSSIVKCTSLIWQEGGLRAFYKGWSANYARLGPQTVITFVVNEHLRQMMQLKSL